MSVGSLRAVVIGLAVAAAALGSHADPIDGERTAADAVPLQIYAVPALADGLRDVASADACPETALPELVLADAATLVRLIARGAPADVLAIDDAAAIEGLVASGQLASPRRFAAGAPPRAASYWIAPRSEEPRAVAARAFVERVTSALGQARLQRHGFLPAAE